MPPLPDTGLSPKLSEALSGLVGAIGKGMADAEAKVHLPMVSRLYDHCGVHVYLRCLVGRVCEARYRAPQLSPAHGQQLARAVVIADIELAQELRGQGFFQALVQALAEPRLGIGTVEVENVFNVRLTEHLQRAGWKSRNGLLVGGCWYAATAPRA